MPESDSGDATRPHTPSDPEGPRTKPAPAPFSQPQQHSGCLDVDDYDHYGDDEQEYDHDESEREPEPEHSPAPPPAQQLQHQPRRWMSPQQQQQQPQPLPPPSPFVAHVHFHSRVRITSGLRHSRGTHTLGDSSDSDSPSSSISAPLRFRSRDTVPRTPLAERVSRLAAQALQKRRAAAAAATATSSTVSGLGARAHEHTPLFGAGVPVAYGAAQCGDSASDHTDADSDGWHGEDELAFGKWPWRALNRRVSDSCFMHSDSWLMVIRLQWWKWQIESTLCCCCSDESDAGE